MVGKTMNKRYITYGLIGVLTGSLAIAASVYTGAQQVNTVQDSSAEHEMGEMSMPGMAGSSEADSHSQNIQAVTQAKLAVSGKIAPRQPTPLTIDIQNANGQAIAGFETFQEKLMHLIIVSDDLQVFEHIHPDYQNNGRFTVQATFPQPGNYTLFSDYKPVNQRETVSVLKVTVPGAPLPAPTINLDRSKTIGATQASLDVPNTIKAGQEVTVTFNLKDTATNQPIQDLQPYLGAQGHLVILHQSSSALSRADYIHAHALRNTPTGQVSFMTAFPKPGQYKLWGQFDRAGKIMIADFWVNVQ